MSTILARLCRLGLLVQAALTSPKLRRNRRALRVVRHNRPSGSGTLQFSAPTLPLTFVWGRALALQPARARTR